MLNTCRCLYACDIQSTAFVSILVYFFEGDLINICFVDQVANTNKNIQRDTGIENYKYTLC